MYDSDSTVNNGNDLRQHLLIATNVVQPFIALTFFIEAFQLILATLVDKCLTVTHQIDHDQHGCLLYRKYPALTN